MALTWFTHEPMSYEEAKRLVGTYKKKGYKVRFYLSDDSHFFIVQVKLLEYKNEPKKSTRWQSKMWR